VWDERRSMALEEARSWAVLRVRALLQRDVTFRVPTHVSLCWTTFVDEDSDDDSEEEEEEDEEDDEGTDPDHDDARSEREEAAEEAHRRQDPATRESVEQVRSRLYADRRLPWEASPAKGVVAQPSALRATWLGRNARKDVWVWVHAASDPSRAELRWALRTREELHPPASLETVALAGSLPLRCVGRVARPAPRLVVLRVAPRALREARGAGGPELSLEAVPGRADEAAFAQLVQTVDEMRVASPAPSPKRM